MCVGSDLASCLFDLYQSDGHVKPFDVDIRPTGCHDIHLLLMLSLLSFVLAVLIRRYVKDGTIDYCYIVNQRRRGMWLPLGLLRGSRDGGGIAS